MEYERLNGELLYANEKKIHEMTGCLSKCDKYAYKIWPVTDLRKSSADKSSGGKIWFGLYHPTGETELREQVRKKRLEHSACKIKNLTFPPQYILYDWNAMVADIGGYLGLLLGHSAYSVFEMMVQWTKNNVVNVCQRVGHRSHGPKLGP